MLEKIYCDSKFLDNNLSDINFRVFSPSKLQGECDGDIEEGMFYIHSIIFLIWVSGLICVDFLRTL